mmetsp:Transcript_31404/g.72846  ORF Transcript_31404/g.72846 Transcript_31404/m.72846 type:complete len:1104 (+) Transcript_31404:60-3371(+)
MVVLQEVRRRFSHGSSGSVSVSSSRRFSDELPGAQATGFFLDLPRTLQEEVENAKGTTPSTRIKVKRASHGKHEAFEPWRRQFDKKNAPPLKPPPLPFTLGSEELKRENFPQLPGGIEFIDLDDCIPSRPGDLDDSIHNRPGPEGPAAEVDVSNVSSEGTEAASGTDGGGETEQVIQTRISLANVPHPTLFSDMSMSEFKTSDERLMLRHTNFFTPPKTRSSCWILEQLVARKWFEPVVACLIVLNTLVMAAEMQYYGVKHGYEIAGELSKSEEYWPWGEAFFTKAELFFGIIFSVEIMVKILAIRLNYFCDIWNVLDVICVFLWISGVIISLLTLDPAVFRMVRLVRLLRMLRIVKVLNGFESLYLMTSSIKASILALVWSTFLIFLIQMSTALVLNQMLQDFLKDPDVSEELRHQVFRYFGTFSKAFLTMFEYMLANWPDASRVLTDVNEAYVLFILGYQCIIGFAVVKVIMGVFLQVTFNMAATDDIIMVSQKQRQINTHKKKISQLFKHVDQNSDGILDKAEFREIVGDDIVRQWLASMDCDVSLFCTDPDVLFSLVDDGDGKITLEELVTGLARMSGTARSIDLAKLAYQNQEVKQTLKRIHKDVEDMNKFLQGRDAFGENSQSPFGPSSQSVTSELRFGGGLGDRAIKEKRKLKNKAVSTLMWKRTMSLGSLAQVEQSRCWSTFQESVKGPRFEGLFGALIILHTVLMAVEVQYDGMEVGHQLNYPGENRPAAEVWPWAQRFFKIITWFFVVAFTIELILKLLGLQLAFFKDPWNYLDLITVVCSMVEAAATGILPLNPSMLRFARLTRLLRMLKIVKAIKGFDSLHLMITSIKGSVSALFWSSALMFVVQMLIALVLVEMLDSYLKDESQEKEDRHRIYMYFGTFSKAMLTMFEITLANWIPCARALTERVNEWYMVFALTHKFIIGFAVVMVVTGVFLSETFRVAATDDMIMITQRQRQIKTHVKKMSLLFKEFDADRNGILDRAEFRALARDPAVVTWLSSMGLEVNDADTLFTMVTKESGGNKNKLTALELVKGVAHLKGSAKSIDMAVVMKENRELLRHVHGLKAMLARMSGARTSCSNESCSSPVERWVGD